MNSLLVGFKHIKTTIAGICSMLAGLGALGVAIQGVMDGKPFDYAPFAAAFAMISGGIGLVFDKDADKSNAPTPTAAATKIVTGAAILFALGLGAPTFAQDTAGTGSTAAPSAPLVFSLSSDLTLRPNLSVIAFSYDATHKAYLGQGQIAGLYALTSKRLYEAGVIAGGAITFDTSSRPVGEVNAGVVSPRIPLSPALSLHAAVMYARRFGPDPANLLRIAPTLEF